LQVSIHGFSDYIEDILNRADGLVYIEHGIVFGDGRETIWDEIAMIDDWRADYSRGAVNESISIVGYDYRTNTSGQNIEVLNNETLQYSNHKYQFRAPINRYLRPGDRVFGDGFSFVARLVTQTVDEIREYMDVTE